MKKYLFLTLVLFSLSACVSMQGKEDYIPVGPQNLSIQFKDGKDLPVFTHVTQITRPWGNIGLQRIKYLPNDPKIIEESIARMKNFAAAHGADAMLIKQYFDENEKSRPVNLATNLVKYLDDLSKEDEEKIVTFAQTTAALNEDK